MKAKVNGSARRRHRGDRRARHIAAPRPLARAGWPSCLVASCALALLVAPAGALAAPTSAYVANYASPGLVSQFTIGAGGLLSANGSVPSGGDEAWYSAMTPDGSHLYVTNFDSDIVGQYGVGAGGKLTPLSPATVAVGGGPIGIAISPDGKSAYVAGASANVISLFNIAADGSLSPKSEATVSENLDGPYGIAISPDGRSLYVTNIDDATIAQFDVGGDGSLTAKATPTVATGPQSTFVTLTPDGKNAYVTNSGDGAVSEYAVGADGSLTPLGASAPAGGANENLYSATVSPDGRSLYAPNEESVYQFDIGPGGALTPKAPVSVGGAGEAENLWMSADGRDAYLANYDEGGESVVSEYDVGGDGSLTAKSSAEIAAGSGPASVIIPPDRGPVASFGASPAEAGSPTRFDGSGSSDADGTVARYDWSFGDGSVAGNAGPTPTHVYAAPGTYTVTLTTTDDSGCSTSFVFTGQTAYCDGGPSARTSRTVTVPGAAAIPAPAVTGPPPSPAADEEAGTARAARAVAVRGRKALVKLTCAGPGACRGSLRLLVRVRGKHARGHHGSPGRQKTVGEVVVGQAHFSIAKGKSKTVRVRLSPKGGALVRKAGRRGLKLTVKGSGVKTGVVVLKSARSRHRQRRSP